jgi:predicted amino acid racemase
MFLDVLRRRNPQLIEQAIALHQAGKLPANAYVIDLDGVEANARAIADAAEKLGLTTFAMTKQMGRNASFCAAVKRGGIGKAVAVDVECARAAHRACLKIGHIGHLSQVPREEADAAAAFEPDYWTAFSLEKANEVGVAARKRNRHQPLLARIRAEGDQFYRGHEGGFLASEITAVADAFDQIDGARFAGITTFPALLFDPVSRKVKPTPNLETLRKTAKALAGSGRPKIEINAPGTTSSSTLASLAEAGATQIEPGHGLTGTTPLHAVEDLPERPAVVYLTEVSHLVGDEAFCFGGGLYIDPVFPDYQVKAIVSREPTAAAAALLNVELPSPAAIDYYGMIEARGNSKPRPGDSVVFGFRPQAFVTRAYVVGVGGLSRKQPTVEAFFDAFGRQTEWP